MNIWLRRRAQVAALAVTACLLMGTDCPFQEKTEVNVMFRCYVLLVTREGMKMCPDANVFFHAHAFNLKTDEQDGSHAATPFLSAVKMTVRSFSTESR
jgi:hypothetical protein